jgi:C4-dicarboxylate-specific signal transduction histidine kinase
MREFYRQREPQLSLARIDLNRTIEQAIELTHARWSDLPQQRGVMIELRTEATPGAAEVMAAEGEVRDALTNLIFNAVDAMPEGGTLTVRTRIVDAVDGDGTPRVHIEVSDTGVGMDEASAAAAWGSRWSTAWCNGTVRSSKSTASRATAARSASSSPRRRRRRRLFRISRPRSR